MASAAAGCIPPAVGLCYQSGMDPVYVEIALRLLLALACGGLIGLERSYHGRPAGFRTHALVCLSTSLLMLVTVYEERWVPQITQGRVAIDPTRMAQGIMTGIGFLGAGAIIKDGVSVRGLTTAASIWITAAIGVLLGIGFYFPAALAIVLTVGTLSIFRWVESRLPAQFFALLDIRLARAQAPVEDELRRLIGAQGFAIGSLSYHLNGDSVEYHISVRARRAAHAKVLVAAVSALPSLLEFRLVPTGD
jgi:putative Mg2+ transporter-C (MgtC) family protein